SRLPSQIRGAHYVARSSPIARRCLGEAGEWDEDRLRSGWEMLRYLEALRLVVRADALAVERVGSLQHLLVDKPADDLAVLEDKGHFARAHLQHRARSAPARARVAEAGVEEPGIVHAKLAHQRIERHHLGGVVGWHRHRLFRREDVELVGVEDKALILARTHRLPELANVVARAALDVDEAGVAFGAVADEAIGTKAGEVHAHRDAFAH